MAKIPVIKRLAKEDFKNIDEKLLNTLNTIFESLYNVANNGISYNENMASAILEYTTEKYQTVSSTTPLKILWPRNTPPKALWIGNITEVDATESNVATSSAPSIEWYYSGENKQVVIKKIYGLTLDGSQTKRYKLVFVSAN